MPFPNFLGDLAGMQGPMIEGMGGLDQSLAQNTALGRSMPQPKPKKPFAESKFGQVLGMLGDALLVNSGRRPMYAPMMEQRQEEHRRQATGEALANYLGNLDPGLVDLIRNDPSAGLQVYKMMHPEAGVPPETIRLMQSAGIDPQSDEGKAIIRQHLQGGGQADATFVRELTALGIDPHSDEARELYYGRNSPAGFLLKPPPRQSGQGAVPSSGGPPVGMVVGGHRFKGGNPNDRNSWEPVSGGPTPQASGPFPAPGY